MSYDYNNFKKENQKISDLLNDLQATMDPEKRQNLFKELKNEVDSLYTGNEPGFLNFFKQSGGRIMDQIKDGYSSIKTHLGDLFTSSSDENTVGEKIKNTYNAFNDYIKGGENYFQKDSMEKEDTPGQEMENSKKEAANQ